MHSIWIDRLRARVRTDHRLRRLFRIVPLGLFLTGAGLRVVVDSDLVLPPRPADFSVAIDAPLYRTAESWSITESQRRGASGLVDNPATRLECGYGVVHEAGMWGIQSWLEVEFLWIRAAPLANGDAPGQQTLTKLLAELTPNVLGDRRMSGRRVSVESEHPERYRLNWRGFIGWWAGAMMWAACPLIGGAGWILWSSGRRPVLVQAGLCPVCRYSVSGLDAQRCPECGEGLSVYEQTIIAAQIRPMSPAGTRV